MPFRDDDAIRALFSSAKVIAVVGLSSKRARASYGVSRYMQAAGYRTIPVNPNESEVLGEKAYADLDAIPKDLKIDVVNIFRRPEEVPEVVDAAIRLGVPTIWMQEGVIHDEAAAKARAAGIFVVMDRCLLKDHQRLLR
jgi:predicted CoA-binding protein